VFDGALPADLSLVWNPRLTATAGQVVDDGSMNHLKASREQRIPVRLELSSKVGVGCAVEALVCPTSRWLHSVRGTLSEAGDRNRNKPEGSSPRPRGSIVCVLDVQDEPVRCARLLTATRGPPCSSASWLQ
jgi:hypothetical protein